MKLTPVQIELNAKAAKAPQPLTACPEREHTPYVAKAQQPLSVCQARWRHTE
jgi:hypothetical protein